MKIFKNGLVMGLILQLAIGPVFFFIANLTLQKTIFDGFAGVIAVTLVDYLYIALAIVGVGKLLEKKKIKKTFGIASSIILIIFGIFILKGVTEANTSISLTSNTSDLIYSFSTVFFLTISSPMTIVFWTSLFSVKALEFNYSKRELLLFGLAAGLATFIFMGTSVVLLSLIKKTVPILLMQILNLIVGTLLVSYGTIRLKRVLKKIA